MAKTISKKAQRRQQQQQQQPAVRSNNNDEDTHLTMRSRRKRPTSPPPPLRMSRQVRAIHNSHTIRVYQAYRDAIAIPAVEANSLRAPWEAGVWSSTRMTWIKPSKVWMAYRCQWTMKRGDANQSRVLALDLARPAFEELMRQAVVVDHPTSEQAPDAKESPVIVQWDPERYMTTTAGSSSSPYTTTSNNKAVRSIQIGLRGTALERLLDDTFVVRITDVTQDFRQAVQALQAGDLELAQQVFWPNEQETVVQDFPDDLCRILGIQVLPDERQQEESEGDTNNNSEKD